MTTNAAFVVKVNGSPVNVIAGTLDANNTIGQRSMFTFQAWDVTGALVWDQGSHVELYDLNNNKVYGGFVEQDVITKPGYSSLLEHSVTCKDYHYLADKRLAARSYLNQQAGQIVLDLLDNYLASEGVTVTSTSISMGPTLPEVVFNYELVSKCIDAIAQQAGYWWQIDQNAVLYFQPYGAINAPYTIDGSTVALDDTLRLTVGNPQYVNRQFVTGGYDKTNTLTETRMGDGHSRAFALKYEVSADVPVIQVNGVSQTVNIKGRTSGYQWYYAEGDQTIAQDDAGTVLGIGDTLTVTYKGRYPIVALAQNNALITQQQTLEGMGTGYVDSKYTNKKIKTLAGGFQIASSLLAHYGQKMHQLTWRTKQSGFQQGQLVQVNLPAFSLNTQMLIQTVEITDGVDDYNIWYIITAVGSPIDVTWQTLFQNLANQSDPMDQVNVGDDGTLAILTQWSAAWGWTTGTLTPTSFTCFLCGNSTLCGASLICC